MFLVGIQKHIVSNVVIVHCQLDRIWNQQGCRTTRTHTHTPHTCEDYFSIYFEVGNSLL